MGFLNTSNSIPHWIFSYFSPSALLYYEKFFCSLHVLPSNLLTETHVSAQQPKYHSVLKLSFVTRSYPCLVNWTDLVNLEFEVVYQAISLEKFSSHNVYLYCFDFTVPSSILTTVTVVNYVIKLIEFNSNSYYSRLTGSLLLLHRSLHFFLAFEFWTLTVLNYFILIEAWLPSHYMTFSSIIIK